MSPGVVMNTEPTRRPWSYRPLPHDDWGYIRGPQDEIVCVARAGLHLTDDQLNEHRQNKTDPYGPNARLIVQAVNERDALIAALEAARDALNSTPAARQFVGTLVQIDSALSGAAKG